MSITNLNEAKQLAYSYCMRWMKPDESGGAQCGAAFSSAWVVTRRVSIITNTRHQTARRTERQPKGWCFAFIHWPEVGDIQEVTG